ncbi:MAG TPA: sigma-E factor negative regulatory protein [Burkholderiales bacterium]|nr:sigma-E factor negative regulatory protein [Burkholderiales bacterium]
MERISAFMDGEVEESEVTVQVRRMKEDPQLRAVWGTYHLIGDTLRGERIGLSQNFNAKLGAKLVEEPTILAPRRRSPLQTNARRFALPVAASLGGVALVVWLAVFNNPFAPPKENLALNAPVPLVGQTQLAANPASVEVNDYLLAHQQFSPSTTMQGVASYVRTVSGQGVEEKR